MNWDVSVQFQSTKKRVWIEIQSRHTETREHAIQKWCESNWLGCENMDGEAYRKTPPWSIRVLHKVFVLDIIFLKVIFFYMLF